MLEMCLELPPDAEAALPAGRQLRLFGLDPLLPPSLHVRLSPKRARRREEEERPPARVEIAMSLALPRRKGPCLRCRQVKWYHQAWSRMCRPCAIAHNGCLSRRYGPGPLLFAPGTPIEDPKFPEPTRPATPTTALPGSRDKVDELRRRLWAGEELWHPQDAKLEGVSRFYVKI